MHSKRTLCCLFLLLIVSGCLVAACGTTSATTSPSTSPATPTTSSAPSSAATPTPTATTAASSGPVIKTASATLQGKTTTILTDAQGKTLYYFKPDTATTVACTGGCASNWPPLTFSGSGSPSSATPLPGTLSVLQGANGAQVEYQGHPLYTFAGDTAPGQTSGEGKGGVWFVATPDLAAQG